MKLSKLYQKFHGGTSGQLGCKVWQKNIPTKISSVDSRGVLKLNDVLDVIDKGERQTLEICAKKGKKKYTLICTPDHEILTPQGWLPAEELKVGSNIKTNGLIFCDVCGKYTDHTSYKYSEYFGECKPCTWSKTRGEGGAKVDKDGYKLVYRGTRFHPNRNSKGYVREHHLSYEAYKNGLTLPAWIKKLERNELENCFFVPRGFIIHHKNGTKTDNRPVNLEMLTPGEHMAEHDAVTRLPRMVVSDAQIMSIRPTGKRHVYDIKMKAPHHNFIANGVVVHNCGKTIVAALIVNALPLKKFIYVCPPFLLANVEAEFQRWMLEPSVSRWTSNKQESARVALVPDSILGNTKILNAIQNFGLSPVLIVDEAHRFKNLNAKRTEVLFKKIAPHFQKQIYMSGTPMMNRPMELYSVLSHAAPSVINHMSKFEYGRRYCAGHHDGFGWNFEGASNLNELQGKIRLSWEELQVADNPERFMLRIKKDVLDLPPKVEEVVFIGDHLPTQIRHLDRTAVEALGGDEDELESVIAERLGKEMVHLSTYRKELGKLKAETALPMLKALLEETDEAMILAVCHKEAAARLVEGLSKYEPLLIDGSVKPELRVGLANEFQTNPKRRVIVLNIASASVGLNLQRASRVIFVEFSWVDNENIQLESRAIRYGQKASVLVQYLIFKNSIDRVVIETALNKRRVTAYI
ncbi:MAG TPA: SNF2-related protein [Rhabdochlamydiaceae bacterium]